jgi:Zn-dependent protease with chaperone function
MGQSQVKARATIDLVFIMPTFVLTALWLLRGRALGIVGIPALFVLGIGILSPLALGELLAPVRFGRPMNLGEFWLYSTLSLSFVIFAAVYLTALKLPKRSGEERISSK